MKDLVYVVAPKSLSPNPKAVKITKQRFYHSFDEAQEAILKMNEVFQKAEVHFGVFTATLEVLKEVTEVEEEDAEV